MLKKNILIVDDQESMRHSLSLILKREGYEVDTAADANEALGKVKAKKFNFILTDIKMPRTDGMQLLLSFKKMNLESTIIMMSAYGSFDTALEAIKLGAYDYISKPFKPDEIMLTLKKAEERERLKRENIFLRKEVKKNYNFSEIITQNEKMLKIFETIRRVAGYKTTVLITGESGTGKELIARAIHNNSDRKNNPFIALNCGAIPENLLESELFGFNKGAFTDARENKKGLLEEAEGGTVLLDEIAELPFNLQVKLLRVIQEEKIRHLGDTKEIKIDIRIMAATTKDMEKEVKKGRFRNDLFYRINVLKITLPPLRERKEDIPFLVNYFINKYGQSLNKRIKGIENSALDYLISYDWPGNVRELENIIERAMIFCEEDKIKKNNFFLELEKYRSSEEKEEGEKEFSLRQSFKKFEKRMIAAALEKSKGNRTEAAKLLNIGYRSLMYKIKEYNIHL